MLGLGACGDPVRDNLTVGTIGVVTGFAGLVAVDEPRAGLIARDALSAGGSAVDAAVAAAWAMAVTYPSAVGVGGGGVCVVHDARSRTTEVLDFLPPPAIGGSFGASGLGGGDLPGMMVDNRNGWPVAVPALPRGLFVLHAKYGRLRWEATLAPAEQLARFGEPVSRALAAELTAVGGGLTGDASTRAVFGADSGRRLVAEGERLTQPDLAATLGRLRQHGVGTLYDGTLANDFLTAVADAGGRLERETLRAWRPQWKPTGSAPVGNETLHVPASGMVGHELLAAWQGRAPASGEAGAPARGGAALLVVDGEGSAVACGLTMNGAFGLGRMAGGTGILLAQPGPREGQSLVPLAAGLLVNHHVNSFRHGVVAAGAGAVANAAQASRRAWVEGQQDPAPALSGLAAPAHTHLATCREGVPERTDTCRVGVDPRGAGLPTIVGPETAR